MFAQHMQNAEMCPKYTQQNINSRYRVPTVQMIMQLLMMIYDAKLLINQKNNQFMDHEMDKRT